MIEKTFETRCGIIHYWTSEQILKDRTSLIFLPGLTADHRLFDKQIEYFEGLNYNLFVWDAPGHNVSWPFTFDFDLKDKADWLDEILEREGLVNPVIIGQSMGGYVGQAYMQYHPGKLKAFVSIDSAPLQRCYVTAAEIWMLKNVGPVYRWYPWKALLKTGSDGVADSEYGRALMKEMMMVYDGDQVRYAKLSGHGFGMLARAMELDLPYKIDCPALLICGEHDKAGSAKNYNKRWHKKSGLPIAWIRNAGHNANTDKPEEINTLIESLLTE